MGDSTIEKLDAERTEPGSLVYSTPPYSRRKRIVATIVFFIALCIPLAFVIRSIQINVWTNQTLSQNVLLLTTLVIVVLADTLFTRFILSRILPPKLRIYKNGITRFVIAVFTQKEGDFVPFSHMESFSISKNGLTCAIVLEGSDIPVVWSSHDASHISPIIDVLRERGIPETK
ncbi:MAG: hypothetical protein ACE5KV_06260 [Thermoplasmata archaeon]